MDKVQPLESVPKRGSARKEVPRLPETAAEKRSKSKNIGEHRGVSKMGTCRDAYNYRYRAQQKL